MNDRRGRERLPAVRAGRLIAMATVATCLSAGAAFAADDIEAGRALAERLCARCHMAPGQGEKQGANDIPGFTAIAQRRNQTHEGIVAWLRSIPPMMPNHHLSQDEMHALAAYIVTLGTAPRPGPQR
jgi:mono/diheme cytochrome c family protein